MRYGGYTISFEHGTEPNTDGYWVGFRKSDIDAGHGWGPFGTESSAMAWVDRHPRRRRRRARENPSKTTLYWVLGGVGVVGIGGLIYWLATRNKTAAMQGGGGSTPLPSAPAPQQGGGGGGGGTPAGQPPSPASYQGGTNNPNFANDINKWVQNAVGILTTIKQGSQTFNVLYSTIQGVIAQFGFLLPANPLPVF